MIQARIRSLYALSLISITAKELTLPDDYSEVHFDQLLQAKNIEAIYEEFLVTAFFATEGCNDPRVLQDEALEGTPLGTLANYRAKILDAAMCFIACNQKWMAFHTGPLVQSFPKQIPPRKYLSHKLAHTLKLPYTCAEAFQKFKKLLNQCKEDWEVDDKIHGEQMRICREMLELGAYVLPGEVIASEKMKDFVSKCLQKELLLCIKKIRQGKLRSKKNVISATKNDNKILGLAYKKPCAEIHSILNIFAKISGEFLPYTMYVLNKTSAMICTTPTECPVVSVKLHAKNGNVDLFMVSRINIAKNMVKQFYVVQLQNPLHTIDISKFILASEFCQK